MTEPFSLGFDPEMAFTVAIPEDYKVVSTRPEPSSSTKETATWDADPSLQGFELVTEPAFEEASPTEETDGDGAGFGVMAALGALLSGAFLIARSRSVPERARNS